MGVKALFFRPKNRGVTLQPFDRLRQNLANGMGVKRYFLRLQKRGVWRERGEGFGNELAK